MKVNAQSVNFTADGKLIDFVQKRMDKLELFYDKVIESDVYLKVENTSAKENKIVEIMVFVPQLTCQGIGTTPKNLSSFLTRQNQRLS